MPSIEITLPVFHAGQVEAYRLKADARGADPANPQSEKWARNTGRFKAIRCGRRWGKTDFGKTVACSDAAKGKFVFWAAPDYKIMSEAFNEIADILAPIKKSSSKIDGIIRTVTGGRIDFWTLENERAGRSRKYHRALIDEGAFTKPNMMDIWNRSIMPTLLDYEGAALVLSNTNGVSPENFFWQICNEPEHGFIEYHAPSAQNPYLPVAELERLRRDTHPLVFQQEYLAEFVDWSGVQFFDRENTLVNGEPVAYPPHCDAVFAVLDTAIKTGKENDGTAVSFYSVSRHDGYPMILLDWDIVQIEGSLLEQWLPSVFERLEYLAGACQARRGAIGVWIEDAASGQILLQQGRRRGWNVHALEGALTAVGKDERAISVSGYVYQGKIKMSAHSYNKVTSYKGHTLNHFMSQVFGFRIGVKDQADDLLDTFTYAISIALGNKEGS